MSAVLRTTPAEDMIEEWRSLRFAEWAMAAAAPLLMGQSPPASPALNRILDAHNQARAEVGIDPLRWSSDLASEAKDWANHLARTERIAHPDRSGGSGRGENLWIGSKGRYSPDEMVGSWTGEKRHYRAGSFPANSADGDWQSVGHYTQIVWRDSREIGCAMATGRTMDILVCRYRNPGNILGQRPY